MNSCVFLVAKNAPMVELAVGDETLWKCYQSNTEAHILSQTEAEIRPGYEGWYCRPLKGQLGYSVFGRFLGLMESEGSRTGIYLLVGCVIPCEFLGSWREAQSALESAFSRVAKMIVSKGRFIPKGEMEYQSPQCDSALRETLLRLSELKAFGIAGPTIRQFYRASNPNEALGSAFERGAHFYLFKDFESLEQKFVGIDGAHSTIGSARMKSIAAATPQSTESNWASITRQDFDRVETPDDYSLEVHSDSDLGFFSYSWFRSLLYAQMITYPFLVFWVASISMCSDPDQAKVSQSTVHESGELHNAGVGNDGGKAAVTDQQQPPAQTSQNHFYFKIHQDMNPQGVIDHCKFRMSPMDATEFLKRENTDPELFVPRNRNYKQGVTIKVPEPCNPSPSK
jgi:hypothetical protein